jgi:indolepyruvate ferredoxin oxidoreductase beta subunit
MNKDMIDNQNKSFGIDKDKITSSEINIVLAGVGGQGTLLAGKLLGSVAQNMSWDVKVSEVHGMSQRGGSVVTYVRMGKKVFSPVVEKGMADFVLAFEELEALRWAPLLSKDKILIVNQQKITPATVATGSAVYPDNIDYRLQMAGLGNTRTYMIPAYDISIDLGNVRAVNMVMIGAMSKFMDIPEEIWEKSIKEVFPEKLQRINREAFEKGRMAIK